MPNAAKTSSFMQLNCHKNKKSLPDPSTPQKNRRPLHAYLTTHCRHAVGKEKGLSLQPIVLGTPATMCSLVAISCVEQSIPKRRSLCGDLPFLGDGPWMHELDPLENEYGPVKSPSTCVLVLPKLFLTNKNMCWYRTTMVNVTIECNSHENNWTVWETIFLCTVYSVHSMQHANIFFMLLPLLLIASTVLGIVKWHDMMPSPSPVIKFHCCHSYHHHHRLKTVCYPTALTFGKQDWIWTLSLLPPNVQKSWVIMNNESWVIIL